MVESLEFLKLHFSDTYIYSVASYSDRDSKLDLTCFSQFFRFQFFSEVLELHSNFSWFCLHYSKYVINTSATYEPLVRDETSKIQQ